MFREEIAKRYANLYGRDYLRLCSMPIKKSIRVNTQRTNQKELRERLEKQRFELSESSLKNAFIIERERKPLGGTIEHMLGYFYIQEITSMMPPLWLKPKTTDLVLDMSAAPGGKTTHLSELMRNQGEIIAIDLDKRKNKAMISNLDRMGCTNTTFLNMDSARVAELGMKFDKILLDAPCSCSGIIMKDYKIKQKLTLNFIKKYSQKQKILVKAALSVLKDDGRLVYSTCSVDPLENDGVIDYAQQALGAKLVRKKQFLPDSDGMVGFFVAEMKK